MRADELLFLSAIILIPILVSGFCWWRATLIPQLRTPHNTRFLARKVTPLIVINVGIAVCCTLIGLVMSVALLADDKPDVAMIFGAYAVFGILLGVGTRPLFKIRSALRALNDDEDYSVPDLPRPVSESFGITLWWSVAVLISAFAMCLSFGLFLVSAFFFGLIPLLLWQRRRGREGQFLWLLALSVRNNHDLAQEVQDHAATWSGSYATRLRQLAVYLNAGRPLGLALERVPGLLPRWVIASIKIGDETGTLSEVLSECATAELNWMKNRFRTGSIASLLIYLVCYPWVIIGPVSFMIIYIVPKMKVIFQGFGTEMPSVTESFLDACDTWLGAVVLFTPFAFIAALLLLRFDHSGWRNVRTGLFRTFYTRYDSSPIMRHLARMIEKGRTLPDSLLAIANSYHRPTVAESIADVYVETESGGDCWKSLLKRGFLSRRDLALIEAAQRVGNLPWALREIADVREKRYIFRVDTLVQLFRPIPIIAIGLFVGWVCIAMFMPVVKLVNDLS
ncbi:MAG: type IV pilus assembly protein PilC [Planctomycetaceae bacterium]